MLASGIELGHYNFISITWDAYRYLSSPTQIADWHTKGWRWVEFLPYLLVPPAVLGAWALVFVRRPSQIPTAQLFIGLACAGQMLVFIYLQFFGSVQTLEEHYFSSTLWGSVCLTMAVTIAEAARPMWSRGRLAMTLPVAIVLAIPLIYEFAPSEPSYKWIVVGLLLAAFLAAGGALAHLATWTSNNLAAISLSAAGIILITASALYLTAVPVHKDPLLNSTNDPAPAYAGALGGSAESVIDLYRVTTALPAFVGNATYKDEQLLMWWPSAQAGILSSPTGMYHYAFNSLPSAPPQLTVKDMKMLQARRPAELLLLNVFDTGPADSLAALARYHPVLLRSTELHSGQVTVWAWLINLKAFGPAR